MNNERLLKILLAPHVSEKASIAAEKRGQYVFKVAACATKPEVRAAVESLFGTKVSAITILNVKSKPRRFGQIKGNSKAWKKAYVTLKEGLSLNLTGA